jgi:hypothetical protein
VFPVYAAGQLLSSLSGFIHRAKQEIHDIWHSYTLPDGPMGLLPLHQSGYSLLKGTISRMFCHEIGIDWALLPRLRLFTWGFTFAFCRLCGLTL